MFKQIPYAPKYYVSNYGRVYSVAHNKILSPEQRLYHRVFIKTLDGYKHFQVHRLVAEMFCIRTEGQDFVHHIDRDIANNKAENLVWVTSIQHYLIHRGIEKTA